MHMTVASAEEQESYMDRLKDKIALVTGGSKGIGAGIARRFAEEGATVVIASRNRDESQALADELVAEGWKAVGQRLDITSLDEWSAVLDFIMDTYGRIDILVNNAGMANTGAPMEEMDLERDWHALITCNLTGTFYGIYSTIPLMVAKGGGTIVTMSSYVATAGIGGVSGYTAAKGGINALTKAVAADYAKKGIRCNCVSPGATLTPAVKPLLEQMPDVMDGLIEKSLIPRLGTPEDIGDAFVFLASDESAYITGVDLLVDGGFTVV